MFRIFYKKIVVENFENIPKNEAFIFSPNHQNALMDALGVIYTSKTQPFFLARADIFKKPFIAKILNKLRIKPIYRIRDGKNSLQKNVEVFNNSSDILSNKIPLALFPETTHNNKRAMLPIKKGVPRIAFQAEEAKNFSLGLKILPVGIYYSNYENFRTILHVIYGTPFKVSDFKDIYYENQQKSLLKFRDKIAESLEPLMIDIQNKEYYETFENLREIYNSSIKEKLKLKKNCQKSKFVADKKIIKLLDNYYEKSPEQFKILSDKVMEYSKILNKLLLRDWVLEKSPDSFFYLFIKTIGILLLFPINIFGIIFNYLPYKIPVLAIKNVKDPQFHSSIKFVLSLITFPIFYLIFWILFFVFAGSFYLSIIFLIAIPFSGMLAFSSFIITKKIVSEYKFYFLKKKQNKTLLHLINLRKEIIEKMDEIHFANQI